MRARRVALLMSIVLLGAGLAAGQTIWDQHPGNPVLEPGAPGSWDDGGGFVLAVVFNGSNYHLWYEGLSPDGYWRGIGHATSPDRVTWTKDDPANPVLTPGGAPGGWDDVGVSGAAVIWDGAQFRMWYGGVAGDGVERACYATSPDGTTWTKLACNLPGLEPGVPNDWDLDEVRPITVIIEGGTYRMWYSGVRDLGNPIGLTGVVGYAESLDGLNWTKRPDPVLEPDENTWEERITAAPYVIFNGSSYHMFYLGGTEAFPATVRYSNGYAFSADGIHWNKSAANPIIEVDPGFTVGSPASFDGSTWHMWYSHTSPPGWLPIVTSYATSTCCAGLFGDGFETGDLSLWTSTVP
jgi:predicted GH43/DUF377 family glycosyl hydrolase